MCVAARNATQHQSPNLVLGASRRAVQCYYYTVTESVKPSAMGDWQELAQAVIVGLLFSFLVAKLISLALSFKHSPLTLSRSQSPSPPSPPLPADADNDPDDADDADADSDATSDSDSWEGIESTELDEEFSAASAFVATMAASSNVARVSDQDQQLKLYGLYKIATEGPCTAPQPSALSFTARAKWNAWHRLGSMPAEEAMQAYIDIVDQIFPSWSAAAKKTKETDDDAAVASSSAARGPMGPVFSSFIHDEQDQDSGTDISLDAIHVAAREGARDDLLKQLESGVSVNMKEGEGRTPLHWAVDRGHLDIVKELLKANADVNAKDNEGQTPLHYAVVCEREAIAEQLVNHGADPQVSDNDGNSPLDLCDSKWPFMSTE